MDESIDAQVQKELDAISLSSLDADDNDYETFDHSQPIGENVPGKK